MFCFGGLFGCFIQEAFGKYAVSDATEKLKRAMIYYELAFEKIEKDIKEKKRER